MNEYDRIKYPKKKFNQTRDPQMNFGRTFAGNRVDNACSKGTSDVIPKKQPTILIKTREPTTEDTLSKLSHKDEIKTSTHSTKESDAGMSSTFKQMTKSLKLIDDNAMCVDSLQDYLQDNTEFLVVGIIGAQSVGKSTVANLLIQNEITEGIKNELFKSEKYINEHHSDSENVKLLTEKMGNITVRKEESTKRTKVFKVENTNDLENGSHRTQGIDIFITNNRLILLDCQPFISLSVLEELIKYENKRTNLVSEFIPLESSGEIQGLQLATFLMSVCHVLIVVQDNFFDGNIIRFVQSAEMLKPTIPNAEEEVSDHFPHLLFIHNKAQMSDFSPSNFRKMQQIYKMLFKKSKMNIKSGLGLGTGRLINHLNVENCGSPINLFLLPEIDLDTSEIFCGHPPVSDLVKRLRTNILGATRNLLAHVQLSEKMWLIYCSKVWETVKKSSFFVEYMKLMP